MYRRSAGADVRLAVAIATIATVVLVVLFLATVVFADTEDRRGVASTQPYITLPTIGAGRPTPAPTPTPALFRTVPERAPTATVTAIPALPGAPTPASMATPSPAPESEEVILSSVESPTRTPRTPTPAPPAANPTPGSPGASATPPAPRPTSTPTPAPPRPTPTPTETPQQRLMRLALQVLNMRQKITHSMVEGRQEIDLELEIGSRECKLYAQVAEFSDEKYVLSSYMLEYRDEGCDGRVDVAWTDRYRARTSENEALFLAVDVQYRGWLVTMATREGLLK